MSIKLNKIFIFTILLLSIWAVISLSYFTTEYKNLLYLTSRENGLYEWLTVVAGLAITAISLLRLRAMKSGSYGLLPAGLLWLFAVVGVLGSLEEISWGQHIFHFESGEVFKQHNMQQETNLHNFVSQEYVNFLMQGTVYLVFILLPLFTYLKKTPVSNSLYNYVRTRRPSLVTVGVFITSCSFQDYFRPETLLDTTLVWSVSVLYLVTLIRSEAGIQEWFVFTLLMITLLLTAICDPVFRYNNMQYEIRELLILTGFIFWLSEVTSPQRQIQKM